MILNLDQFIATERPKWERLDEILNRLANDPWRRLPLDEARELERLYQRASADLARLATFSAEPETRAYLENLVGRGYAEIHGGASEGAQGWRPGRWFARTLPCVFRKQIRSFWFAFALVMAGALFGGFAVALDPEAKQVLMPFSHLQGDPAERVAREESGRDHGRLDGAKGTFAGRLMTHNIRVTLLAMALGMTWGAGTFVLMLYNGVILGAVAVDYMLAGQTTFLFGWLLPHGVVEIPAMLVGGQAGFVLAGALLGRGQAMGLAARLRAAAPDVVTLCAGAALMLVWAGVVEAFVSQYHAPVLPYWLKIGFGVAEGTALLWYLGCCGKGAARRGRREDADVQGAPRKIPNPEIPNPK